MVEITVKVEGLKCPMCEKHVCEAIEKAYKVESVKASHKKGEVVIISGDAIPRDELTSLINDEGYKATDVCEKPYEKKGLFSFFKKK